MEFVNDDGSRDLVDVLRRQNAVLAQLSFLMSKPDILKMDRAPFVVASSSHEMI